MSGFGKDADPKRFDGGPQVHTLISFAFFSGVSCSDFFCFFFHFFLQQHSASPFLKQQVGDKQLQKKFVGFMFQFGMIIDGLEVMVDCAEGLRFLRQ